MHIFVSFVYFEFFNILLLIFIECIYFPGVGKSVWSPSNLIYTKAQYFSVTVKFVYTIIWHPYASLYSISLPPCFIGFYGGMRCHFSWAHWCIKSLASKCRLVNCWFHEFPCLIMVIGHLLSFVLSQACPGYSQTRNMLKSPPLSCSFLHMKTIFVC